MPSTTIHFPDNVLQDIDRAAGTQKKSRNRFVIEACKAAVEKEQGEWPDAFFTSPLSNEDQKLIDLAVVELNDAVYSTRRNRGAPIL